MRSINSRILNARNITIAICLVFFAVEGAQAQTADINKIWTTVGSAGTVDETDAGKIFFDHSVVQMGRPLGGNLPTIATAKKSKALIPPQSVSAVIRYNVTPVEGLFSVIRPCQTGTGTDCPGIQLQLRYLATSGARVIARLIEVDLATGAEVTRLTFSSGGFPAANNYQVQAAGQCGPPTPRPFDFLGKAYYVEATLTGNRIFGGVAAGIQMIKVANVVCKG